MFQRRNPIPFAQKARNIFWPRIGWRRTFQYGIYRLARMPHSVEATAAALAAGAALTFIPLPGLHVALILLICWMCRLPFWPGVLGTLVGNPWTLPPAFLASYELGQWGTDILMGLSMQRVPQKLSFSGFMDLLQQKPLELILPWVTAGIILAVASYPLFYLLFAAAVRQGHRARRAFSERWRAMKETRP